MSDWKNDLLLYWSGEADADTKQRVEALIDLIEARKLMERGELAKAKKAIDKARVAFPDMLDVRLAYAQWLALDDFTGENLNLGGLVVGRGRRHA